jgi:hypothetical protein
MPIPFSSQQFPVLANQKNNWLLDRFDSLEWQDTANNGVSILLPPRAM